MTQLEETRDFFGISIIQKYQFINEIINYYDINIIFLIIMINYTTDTLFIYNCIKMLFF
jgi:hypothetical protein